MTTAVESKPEVNEKVLPAMMEKNICDNILNTAARLEAEGGLQFPKNYSYANALKSAWLVLQDTVDKNDSPVLTACTKESITNALLDMVIQGLTPAKKQCYFIPFGSRLKLVRSYMGTTAVTKRMANIKDVFANVIYRGDVFRYKIDPATGLKEITEHQQEFGNIDIENITGAYAVILRHELPPYVEVMTMEQIKKAWAQGTAYSSGDSIAHNNFTDEMAKKTVINRACKTFFNSSDDSDLLIDAVNRTTANDYMNEAEYEDIVENEIEENANKDLLDMQLPGDADTEEEKEPQENSGEIDWSSPLAVIDALKELEDIRSVNEFKKKLKPKMASFSDRDFVLIDNAMTDKENEVLRGF